MSYIQTVTVNLLNVFQSTLTFQEGLNIVAGENGTLKSKLLGSIRQGSAQVAWAAPQGSMRMLAINPKRNTESAIDSE